MSPNDIGKDRRLAPRALRIRNRCLTNLAEHHALPLPSEHDVAGFDDTVGLEDSWQRWEKTHAPSSAAAGAGAPRVSQRPPRTLVYRILVGTVLLSAFSAGFVAFKFFERWRDRRLAANAAARAGWALVNDSTIAALRGKLVGLAGSELSLRVSLSPAEVGALVLGGLEPRPRRPLDSLAVRVDTLVWVRGRVRGGARFELGGRVRAVRAGHGELEVTRMSVDGLETLPSNASRITTGGYAGPANGLRFALPAFVADLRLGNRVVELITRATGPRRTRSR